MNPDNFFNIYGVRIFVLADNDDRFKSIPPNNVGMNGDSMIVRESEWPSLREILIAATKKESKA